MGLDIKVYDNGSFDIKLGKETIRNCFPGIDGHSIRSVNCNVTRNGNFYEMTYETLDGFVVLNICESKGELYLKSRLSGFHKMPYLFSPIQTALIENFDGIYKQGFGICGPSGYTSLKASETKNDHIFSYGLLSFISNDNFLLLAVDDHKHFINKFEISFSEGDNIWGGREIKKISLFSVSFQIENLEIDDIEVPVIKISSGNNLHKGLTKAAEMIANTMGARTHSEPAYHWCSWYYLYHLFSHKILIDYLEGFSKLNPLVPLKYIQIDAGYFVSPGDWLLPNYLWPSGLKGAFDDIKKYGYKPGIWIAPFMVGNRSILFKEHPDWVLRGLDNEPFSVLKYYNEPLWGCLDEEIYVLDSSHPLAMKYIKNVFRTLHDWGAELYKTDFMLMGIQDSTKVKRFKPGKTSVEYYRDFLEEIREEIGEESYWLGCIAPFLPSIGYADGMRIAGDLGAQWGDDGVGPVNMIKEIIADNYFNHVYWQNDPDSVMLRDFHIYMSETEIESIALFQAISGGAVYTSDPLHELPERRLNLFRFIKPSKKVQPIIPFLNEERKEIVLIHKINNDKYILFFFNPTQEEIVEYYKMKDLIDISELYLNLWNSLECDTKVQDSITVRIPPHGCKLYFGSSKLISNITVENLWS